MAEKDIDHTNRLHFDILGSISTKTFGYLKKNVDFIFPSMPNSHAITNSDLPII